MTLSIGPSADELDAATRLYEDALPPGTRYTVDAGQLDVLGLPVVSDVLVPDDGPSTHGYGYGASFAEARVGALGELTEDVHLVRALGRDPGETASFNAMCEQHGAARVTDPLTLCLPAGSRYTHDDPLRWVLCRRWPDGEAFVPREFVANRPRTYRLAADASPEPLTMPITNGLGAGRDLAQALVHGMLELAQRDGNTTHFRALDPGIVIELAGVTDPGIRQLIAHLQSHGIEPMAKLAATSFGLTNLYVVDGGNGEPGFPLQVTACGEASHPNAERALRKALLEFMAARCRKAMMHGPLDAIAAITPPGYMDLIATAVDPSREEPRALHEMAHWLDLSAADLRALLAPTVLSETRRVALSDLPSVPDETVKGSADRLALMAERLGAEDLPILYYDASPPGGAHPTPQVVKAIVPGLECETMSYYRIGERGVRRLLDEGSPLVGLGAPPEGAAPVRLTAAATERLGGPAWLDIARIDRVVGALYPLYREPSSHAVQLHLKRR